MLPISIERLLTIFLAFSGSVLLIYGIIYEDFLIAFEYGLKEHIKKALGRRKHPQCKRK